MLLAMYYLQTIHKTRRASKNILLSYLVDLLPREQVNRTLLQRLLLRQSFLLFPK
jgi:hypothetical protein